MEVFQKKVIINFYVYVVLAWFFIICYDLINFKNLMAYENLIVFILIIYGIFISNVFFKNIKIKKNEIEVYNLFWKKIKRIEKSDIISVERFFHFYFFFHGIVYSILGWV
jgi:hypothetical protein